MIGVIIVGGLAALAVGDKGGQDGGNFGLAALAEQDRHVARSDQTEVAMQAVDGMNPGRRRPGGGQGGGDFPRNESGLADSGDDHPAAGGPEQLHRPSETMIQRSSRGADRLGLEIGHSPPGGDQTFRAHGVVSPRSRR